MLVISKGIESASVSLNNYMGMLADIADIEEIEAEKPLKL